MNALDVMKYGHLMVLKTVEGFSDDQWDEEGVCGVWSIRQIVSHLTSYELVLADILRGIARGEDTPLLDDYVAAGPGFNDAEVEKRQGMTWAQALEEYRSAYEQVAAIAPVIPSGTWARVGTLPWYGADYSLDDLIVYQYYGHKREHCAQVEVYRDRRTRGLAGASAAERVER